jgi:hypothetical protein
LDDFSIWIYLNHKKMNKRILQRHAMLKMVIEFCDKPETISKNCEALNDFVNEIKNKLDAYNVFLKKSSENTTSITAEKKKKRLALEGQYNYLLAAAKSFAYVKKDNFLIPNASYTPTDVRRMRDGEIHSRVKSLYNLISPHLEELKKYGVKADCLEKLLELNDDFWNFMAVPRARKNNVRSAIREAEKCINDAMKILTTMLDPLVISLGCSDKKWYNDYLMYRKQRLMATKHTQIKVSVVDEQGEAIENAVVMLKYSETQIKGKTNMEGKFVLDGIKQGVYFINIIKDNYYAVAYEPFRLKLGEKRKVKVVMRGVAEEMRRVA